MSKCAMHVLWAALLLFGHCGEAAADVFRILASNYEAAQARVDLIEQASAEIEISYYSVSNDPLGAMYLALLRDAARRGVRVRLLIDALHNDIPSAVQACLMAEGIEIREYHPMNCSHPGWLNRRLHDKLLVVDCQQVIVGSRNLDERHFGLEKDTQHFGISMRIRYVDRDAYLKGDVARQAHEYFACLWTSGEVRPTSLRDRPIQSLMQDDELEFERLGCCAHAGDNLSEACRAETWLAAATPIAVDCRQVELQTGNDWSAGQLEVDCATLLYDPRGKKHHPRGISAQIMDLIDRAQSSIMLESPYFTLSSTLKQSLVAARDRGVQVRILTNSLESTDQMLVYAAYANQRKFLLRQGIELWEYAGPERYHAKSALIDGCIVMIGSYNFDPRSERLNTEVAVVLADPQAARMLEESIEVYLPRYYRLGRRGRPLARPEDYPGAEWGKILSLQPMRILAPFIRRSL